MQQKFFVSECWQKVCRWMLSWVRFWSISCLILDKCFSWTWALNFVGSGLGSDIVLREKSLSVSCLRSFHDVMLNIKELLKYAWNCFRLVWWYFINYRRAINDVQFGWVHLHHHHQIREEGLWFVVVSSSEAVLSTLQASEQIDKLLV